MGVPNEVTYTGPVPSGQDWADGGTYAIPDGPTVTRAGTPTPADAVKYVGPAGAETIPLEEDEDSPRIERAEQATFHHSLHGSWADVLTALAGIGYGTVMIDSGGIVTSVLSCEVQRHKGANGACRGSLRYVAESRNFDPPPDNFRITPVRLDINIMKHPRYWTALEGTSTIVSGTMTERSANQFVIRALQEYMDNPSFPNRNAIPQLLHDSMGHAAGSKTGTLYLPGTDMAKAAALEIIQKFWRNHENPYIAGLQVCWTTYYWHPQQLDLGGRIEDPVTQANPQVPEFFWYDSLAQPITKLLAALNPQCFSSDGTARGTSRVSWLREGDDVDWQRTWFGVRRTWTGSAYGHWDYETYGRNASTGALLNRPSVPGDYLPWTGDNDNNVDVSPYIPSV